LKVTFPHMGNLHIPVATLLRDLSLEVVVPPPTNQRSLSLGVRHSPESACFPFKLNIGNFIEAHEKGADTILMAGGVGPCRLGYYAQVQKEILRDLGYDFEYIILEPPRGHIGELWEKIRRLNGGVTVKQVIGALRLAWEKVLALDAVEKALHHLRPRVVFPDQATAVYRRSLEALDKASGIARIRAIKVHTLDELESLPRRGGPKPLRVALVGEIYTVLEPFANLSIEERLGKMGVEVCRALFLGDWIRSNLLLDALRLKGGMDVKEAAKPYLNRFVGGEGQESVGYAVLSARRGYDGVLHIAPFTCMPEIVAESILPAVSRDYNIPSMTLMLDEHSAETGIITRLEAFVDLLARRRGQRKEMEQLERIPGD